MPFTDPWLHEGKPSEIEYHHRLYEKTENPIHVWQTIQFCIEAGAITDGFPDWVNKYLADVCDGIHVLFGRSLDGDAKDIPAELASILKFKTSGQGIRGSAFSQWEIEHRNHRLAQSVWHYRRNHPTATLAEACTDISERHAEAAEAYQRAVERGRLSPPLLHEQLVSEETVAKAWRQWQEHLETEDHRRRKIDAIKCLSTSPK